MLTAAINIMQAVLATMVALWVIRYEKRSAVNKCQIELRKQLEYIGADLYGLEKDLCFVIEISNDDARINCYNDVVRERYVRLAKKIMTVWQRIAPDENAPDGQLKRPSGAGTKQCESLDKASHPC